VTRLDTADGTMVRAVKAFASHDWGHGAANHARVGRVVEHLRHRGIEVWFDESHMRGNLLDAMCHGIDSCDVVLCFVTRNYLDKVASGADRDNVRREFMYASERKGGSKMLAIRFDEDLGSTWHGPVGMVLGSQLYCDLSKEPISEGNMKTLVAMLQQHAPSVALSAIATSRIKSASRRAALTSKVSRAATHAAAGAAKPGLHVVGAKEVAPAVALPVPAASSDHGAARTARPLLRARVHKIASALEMPIDGLHLAELLQRAEETLCIQRAGPVVQGEAVFCKRIELVEAQLFSLGGQ